MNENGLFNHIEDCWLYLMRATTVDELEKRIDDMPRWSGNWSIRIDKVDESYEVYLMNSYFDKDSDSYQEDERAFDKPIGLTEDNLIDYLEEQ